jgi:hypothetical protein
MSHVSAIDVLYDGDCEQYARTMWNSMAKHAGDDGVRMDGEYTPGGGWQRFEWKQFSSPAMRSFDRHEDREGTAAPDLPHVEIRYDPGPIREALESHDEPKVAEYSIDVMELAAAAYSGGPSRPKFVYGVSEPHFSRLVENDVPPPVTPESLAEDRIEYASWLMGFPPSIVETYGRETLLSAPAWQTSELPDGGVVILATENPTNVCKPETRAIDQHLDLDPPPETEECDY